jgi:hypothetical protein
MSPLWDWLTNGSNLAATVGLVTAICALWHYWSDTSKRQASVAVAEMLAFFSDASVRKALSAFDYAEPIVMKSLRIHAETYESLPDQGFSEEEKKARDCVDEFLTRLEAIDMLIERGVVSKLDFASQFAYWLELLGELPASSDKINHLSDVHRQELWHYIRRYKFSGVVRLFARYQRANAYGEGFTPR